MKRKTRNLLHWGLILVLLLSVVSCSKTDQSPTQTTTTQLTISAAASLKDAMDEVKTSYAAEKPNVALTINYGSSGSLQKQIEQGADVDVFFSAATKQVDELKAKGLTIDDTIKNLLGNKLVLVVPSDSKSEIKDFQDVTDASIKKLALGEPKSVPAGQYAEEVFKKLNLLEDIKSKTVYGKDVKEVLTWVQTGNADAGIVYATDAKTTDKVKVIATAAEGTHTPIVYPVAIIKSSKNADAAREFLTYLSGDKAKAIFEKYGFTVNIK